MSDKTQPVAGKRGPSPKKATVANKDRKVWSKRSNAVKTKPALPTTKRGRATRQRLKEALAELLQTKAFQEIRLGDITDEAGVRVSLFYHYFQSKIDITQEVLSDLLATFQAEVAGRPRDDGPLAAIHYANQRMVALYASNPGAMRCLLEVNESIAPFGPMRRELTLNWNKRIAANLQRQFPKAFKTDAEYLSLAYALVGTVDNFLFEYFVQKNPVLQQAHPGKEDVAHFLTALWYRALYLTNPDDEFLGALKGLKSIGARELSQAVHLP